MAAKKPTKSQLATAAAVLPKDFGAATNAAEAQAPATPMTPAGKAVKESLTVSPARPPVTMESETKNAFAIRKNAEEQQERVANFTAAGLNRSLLAAINNHAYYFEELYKPAKDAILDAISPMLLKYASAKAMDELTPDQNLDRIVEMLNIVDAYGVTLAPRISMMLNFQTYQQRAAQYRQAFIGQNPTVSIGSFLQYFKEVYWSHTLVNVLDDSTGEFENLAAKRMNAKSLIFELLNGAAQATNVRPLKAIDLSQYGAYGKLLTQVFKVVSKPGEQLPPQDTNNIDRERFLDAYATDLIEKLD